MKYLKIKNNGVLDIRLVALMGGTTKENDKFKIGQFGTGLKYTLAYLFRNNLDFHVFAGGQKIDLSLEKETIRNDVFEIICINGNRTSITTKMGQEWEAWMIVRELWCNALDEGGAEFEITETVDSVQDTAFYIQLSSEIANVVKYWDKYFIHGQSPLYTSGVYKIYPGGESTRFYKNGVMIYEDKNKKALYSYDISNAEINELREFKGNVDLTIAWAWLTMGEKSAIQNLLDKINEESTEKSIDWNWSLSANRAWREAIGTGKIIKQKTLDTLIAKGMNVDEATLIILPESLYNKLNDSFEHISATSVSSSVGDFYEDYDQDVEDRIKQGLVILEACGYKFHPELEFRYGFFEDKMTMAQIAIKQKIVYVSKAMLQKPLSAVVGMLIEENEHFNTGFQDETRAFQQHFIDLYTRQLLVNHQIEI